MAELAAEFQSDKSRSQHQHLFLQTTLDAHGHQDKRFPAGATDLGE
jgi:hypothetical protein